MIRVIALLTALLHAVPAMAADLAPGSWRLILLDGAEFSATATLVVAQDGHISGQAPCNAWFARGAGSDGALFGPIGSTKMACDDLPMENSFFSALSVMRTAEVTSDQLTLAGDGQTMVFVPSKD